MKFPNQVSNPLKTLSKFCEILNLFIVRDIGKSSSDCGFREGKNFKSEGVGEIHVVRKHGKQTVDPLILNLGQNTGFPKCGEFVKVAVEAPAAFV